MKLDASSVTARWFALARFAVVVCLMFPCSGERKDKSFKMDSREILSKVKEVREGQEMMKEQLGTIKSQQSDLKEFVENLESEVENIVYSVQNIDHECGVDGDEILERIQKLRGAQEEMEVEIYNIKDSQRNLDSKVKNIQSTVNSIQNDVGEIVENQEKLFSLQNKIFQILQQLQVEGRKITHSSLLDLKPTLSWSAWSARQRPQSFRGSRVGCDVTQRCSPWHLPGTYLWIAVCCVARWRKKRQGFKREQRKAVSEIKRIKKRRMDEYGISEKVQEVREAQEELEEQLDTIKYNQAHIKDDVESLDSKVEDIQSSVNRIRNNVNEVAEKMYEITANQEKLFSLQNKIFQLLQQQQVEGK
ncbi:uncharacterized protein LOC144629617 [Oculina patagonica]